MAVAQSVASERKVPRTFDGAALLSGATLASGVFAYAYHVLAARMLGPEAYGLVAVLWAALFLLVVVLFRPLEQTTSRAIADRLARGHEVRSVLRAMFRIYLVVAVAVGVAGVAGWSLVADKLFLGDGFFVGALLVALAVYGVAYLLRGVCAGLGWFSGYALLLVLTLTGREDLQPDIRNEAHNEIPSQYLDASRARTELGWTPRYDLDAGLEHAIAWYREFLEGAA